MPVSSRVESSNCFFRHASRVVSEAAVRHGSLSAEWGVALASAVFKHAMDSPRATMRRKRWRAVLIGKLGSLSGGRSYDSTMATERSFAEDPR